MVGFLKQPCSRRIDYLRISVTDRCNLRCLYCMPEEGIATASHDDILTFEETIRLAHLFVYLGIKKIRITGGEPLCRKGIVSLVQSLSNIKGIEEVCLTTNGTLLASYAKDLKEAGLSRVNISLDTLKEDKFSMITRRSSLFQVMEGIHAAKQVGFPLRMNVVVMRGINDDEVLDFVDFAFAHKITVRFIEYMKVSQLWKEQYFLPIDEVKEMCAQRYPLRLQGYQGSGPAQYYQCAQGQVGFITTMQHNCEQCSRLRMTSTGEFKVCLYEQEPLSLRNLVRSGMRDETLKEIIQTKMGIKENVTYKNWDASKVFMSSVGG